MKAHGRVRIDSSRNSIPTQTSKQQVRKMIREDILPAVKVGREWRISEEYLKEFLAQPFRVG